MSDSDKPILDRERFCAMAGSLSDAELTGILEQFWNSFYALAKEFGSQLQAGDRAGAARTAHAIKGAAANIGAARLSAFAAGCERACLDGSAGLAEQGAQLARLIDRTREFVERDAGETEGGETEGGETEGGGAG